MLSLPDLPRRLLNSAVIIVAISAILWFIDQPLVFGLLTVGLILLGVGGIWEYGRITKVHLSPGLVPLLVACHTLILISFFISSTQKRLLFLPLFLLLLGGIIIGIYHFIYPDQAVAAVAQGFFGLCYISCPIGLFIYILHFSVPLTSMNVGRAWAIYLLVVTKITDIGAYLGGNLCGKRLLSPYLSPKKTVEGALAGMFCAMLASCGLVLCCEPLRLFLTIGESVILGALIGVLAQFGDLFESLLKRGAGIKNSGESQRFCRLLGPSGGGVGYD